MNPLEILMWVLVGGAIVWGLAELIMQRWFSHKRNYQHRLIRELEDGEQQEKP